MSILRWNCRGLGNTVTLQVLADIVHQQSAVVIFFMEMKLRRSRIEDLFRPLGFHRSFVRDSDGCGGGLALGWKEYVCIDIISSCNHYIDAKICLQTVGQEWRMTDFYGYPESSRRREAWALLRSLEGINPLPWMVVGDFNDIMYTGEKKGRVPPALWRIVGFREAVMDCGLRNFPFEGYQWTCERGRGTQAWVEEKPDGVLVKDDWLEMFEAERARSVEAPASHHLALCVKAVQAEACFGRKFFKLENNWIKEEECRTIVDRSWRTREGLELCSRIAFCGRKLHRWGCNRV
ncbi:unnamed protein product [Cuscuta europaea]|uniref:Endonuclease/exonuclease/phosphatase domain-containing protein n=1 Tax=Cuscuta europaea TaxID=41803 RepID=A0A9P0ZDT4_CUSEU|nr:unnamed protein product [Cuscuta europaea]